MRLKRPLTATILAVFGLIITGFYWTRAFSAFNQWGFLENLPLSISPLYLVISGVLLGTAGILSSLSLWFGWSFAPKLTPTAAALVTIVYWVEWFFLRISPLERSSFWFEFGFTILALGLILWALQRKKVRLFFK